VKYCDVPAVAVAAARFKYHSFTPRTEKGEKEECALVLGVEMIVLRLCFVLAIIASHKLLGRAVAGTTRKRKTRKPTLRSRSPSPVPLAVLGRKQGK
jgi:hypothetical protein